MADSNDQPKLKLPQLIKSRSNGGSNACNKIGQGNKNKLSEVAEDIAACGEHEERACKLPPNVRSTFVMAFSPDRAKVASTHGDHKIYITDIHSGKCLKTLEGHPRTPWCIAFHPSYDQILASGCLGGEVRIWDLHGGCEVWTPERNNVIASLAFHPTEKILAIATFNEIHFWDWTYSKPLIKCRTVCDREKVRYIKFDPFGKYLITGIANRPSASCRGRPANQNESSQSQDDEDSEWRNEMVGNVISGQMSVITLVQEYQRRLSERRANQNDRPASPSHALALEEAQEYIFQQNVDHSLSRPQRNNSNAPRSSQPSSQSSLNDRGSHDRSSSNHAGSRNLDSTDSSVPANFGDSMTVLSQTLISSLRRLHTALELLTDNHMNEAWRRIPNGRARMLRIVTSILNRLNNLIRNSAATYDSLNMRSEINQEINLMAEQFLRLPPYGIDENSDSRRIFMNTQTVIELNHRLQEVIANLMQSLERITALEFQYRNLRLMSSAVVSSPMPASSLNWRDERTVTVLPNPFSQENISSQSSSTSSLSRQGPQSTSSNSNRMSSFEDQLLLASPLPFDDNDSEDFDFPLMMSPADSERNVMQRRPTSESTSTTRYFNQSLTSSSSNNANRLQPHSAPSRSSISFNEPHSRSFHSRLFGNLSRYPTPSVFSQNHSVRRSELRSSSITTSSCTTIPTASVANNASLSSSPSTSRVLNISVTPSFGRNITVLKRKDNPNSEVPSSKREEISSSASGENNSDAIQRSKVIKKSDEAQASSSNACKTSPTNASERALNEKESLVKIDDCKADSSSSKDSAATTKMDSERQSNVEDSVTLGDSTDLINEDFGGSQNCSDNKSENRPVDSDNSEDNLMDAALTLPCGDDKNSGSQTRSIYTPRSFRSQSENPTRTVPEQDGASSEILRGSISHSTNLTRLSDGHTRTNSNNSTSNSETSNRAIPPVRNFSGLLNEPLGTNRHNVRIICPGHTPNSFTSPSNNPYRFHCDNETTNLRPPHSSSHVPNNFSRLLNFPVGNNSGNRNPLSRPFHRFPHSASSFTRSVVNNLGSSGVNLRPPNRNVHTTRNLSRELNVSVGNNTGHVTDHNYSNVTLRVPEVQIDSIENDESTPPFTSRPRSPPLGHVMSRNLNSFSSCIHHPVFEFNNQSDSATRPPRSATNESRNSNSSRGGISIGPSHLHANYTRGLSSRIWEDESSYSRHVNSVLRRAIDRVISGVGNGFVETISDEVLTHRIQRWKFSVSLLSDIRSTSANVVVSGCKIHNDASVDISKDGTLLAALVPVHRTSSTFFDGTMLGIYSIRDENLGECLHIWSFGLEAITVSLSPLARYVMVGLASCRITTTPWLDGSFQNNMSQILKLDPDEDGCDLVYIRNLHHNSASRRHYVSLNAACWLPEPGDGIIYGTNRGDLRIRYPKNGENIYAEIKPKNRVKCFPFNLFDRATIQDNLLARAGLQDVATMTGTETSQPVTNTIATQTTNQDVT